MDPNVWKPLDVDSEVAWLRERVEHDYSTGFDATGWEASVWVLHSMYECATLDPDLTHDDVHQLELAAGLVERTVIGDCDLDTQTTVIGCDLGFSEHPGPGWSRLRWSALADRLGVSFNDQKFPPSHGWFPYRSWPISIRPPGEGSLDSKSLDSLIRLLTGGLSSAECIAAYSYVSGGWDLELVRCFAGPISRLRDFVELGEWAGTPSNFWSPDRSWMVYTDWDLWATKVSGSIELIQSLEGDDELETLVWERPS
jgi:hypothetical protein